MNARLQSILDARTAISHADTRREVDEAWANLEELRRQARNAFATQRGWIAVPTFTTGELLGLPGRRPRDVEGTDSAIDHRSCFALRLHGKRKPQKIAMVSHLYGDVARCFEFADRYKLAVEILPASWWWPGYATAVLLERVVP